MVVEVPAPFRIEKATPADIPLVLGLIRELAEFEHLLHEARAVQRGCGRFEWSVLDWNRQAIDFYKKLGARPLNDWTTFRVTGEALEQLGRKETGGV